MDYSYFTSAPQPYQFFGLQQNGLMHTQQVEDYRQAIQHDHFDPSFAAFQQSFQYDPSAFLAQAQHPTAQSPPQDNRHDSIISMPDVDLSNVQPTDGTAEEPALARSSSEEKDTLTPQQNRRKAQNRAAQRAFRERKERHVKDLEAKLTSLQQQSASLNGENERLRREIAKIATENEILRATSGSVSNGPTPFMTEPDELLGPSGFSPSDASMKPDQRDLSTKYAHFASLRMLAIDDESGEPLLGAGATWDYIQAHELFRKGLVDVGDVCERLKKMARCDGKGPVFQEKDVRQAIIDSSVAGGRDELI